MQQQCSNVTVLVPGERLRAYPNISLTTTLQDLYFCKSGASSLVLHSFLEKFGSVLHEGDAKHANKFAWQVVSCTHLGVIFFVNLASP